MSAGIAEAAPPPLRTRVFRRAPNVRISAEGAERQSRIALMAWEVLGPDAALAFLNTHSDSLGGRPLNLAVESAAGCEAVERAIAAAEARDDWPTERRIEA